MSDLIPCKTCKKEIAKTAKTCPHCGVSSPNPKASITGNETADGCLGIIVLSIIVAIIMFSCSEEKTPEELAQEATRVCEDKTMAGIVSKDFIKQNLKSPSTADFPFVPSSVTYIGNCVHVIQSYVDSQNGFGAVVRSKTMAKIKYNKKTKNWHAEDVIIK